MGAFFHSDISNVKLEKILKSPTSNEMENRNPETIF